MRYSARIFNILSIKLCFYTRNISEKCHNNVPTIANHETRWIHGKFFAKIQNFCLSSLWKCTRCCWSLQAPCGRNRIDFTIRVKCIRGERIQSSHRMAIVGVVVHLFRLGKSMNSNWNISNELISIAKSNNEIVAQSAKPNLNMVAAMHRMHESH